MAYRSHICIATQILKKQFPKQKWLQDTTFPCCIQSRAASSGSVQIHHNVSNHWVVSSKRGQDVLLTDSRYIQERRLLTHSRCSYKCCIGQGWEGAATESNGCGCFAIVNCYLLRKGEDPAKHRPEQSKLRDYTSPALRNNSLAFSLRKLFVQLGLTFSTKLPVSPVPILVVVAVAEKRVYTDIELAAKAKSTISTKSVPL